MESLNNILLGVSYATIVDTGFYESRKRDKQSVKQESRLVVVSGRTESVVVNVLNTQMNAKFCSLLDNAFANKSGTNCADDEWRGFAVLKRSDGETSGGTGFVEIVRHVCHQNAQQKASIWFFIRGMETVADVIPSLMTIPVFRASVEASGRLLATLGVDLRDCLADQTDWYAVDSAVSLVRLCIGSAVYQMAFVETMRAVGVSPDGYLGVCMSELCCLWALGLCSRSQLLRLLVGTPSAVVNNADTIDTFVAQMPANEVLRRCPELRIGAHVNANYCYVAGNKQAVYQRHRELTGSGFTLGNVHRQPHRFHLGHSPESDLYQTLLRAFTDAVPEPMYGRPPDGAQWLPASGGTNGTVSSLSLAETLTNAVVAPVMIKEAVDRLPDNALAIDIKVSAAGRDTVLSGRAQSVYVRESVPPAANCEPSGVDHLLRELGLAFIAGHWPHITHLMAKCSPSE